MLDNRRENIWGKSLLLFEKLKVEHCIIIITVYVEAYITTQSRESHYISQADVEFDQSKSALYRGSTPLETQVEQSNKLRSYTCACQYDAT